jgi:hypothetical protein
LKKIITVGCVWLFWSSLALAQWNIETVDPQMGHLPCLKLDQQGKPHISYSGGILRHAFHNGIDWVLENVDTEGNVGHWSFLALDSLGRSHISYLRQLSGDSGFLRYAKWDGSSWVIATVDTSDDLYDATNIALDGNDFPHLACHLDDIPYMKYLRWDGSSWQKTVFDSSSPGDASALVVDSLGRAHLTYHTMTLADPMYARWNGTSWVKERIEDPDFSGTVSSLVLDDSLYPQVFYLAQQGSNFLVRHARWVGSGWDLTTVDDSSYSGTSAMVLDSSGRPHITYLRNDIVKYGRWADSLWVIEDVDFGGGSPGYPSIALDTNDSPHIAYEEYGELKYAVRIGTGIEETEVKNEKSLKIDVWGRRIVFSAPKGVRATLSGYDISGRNIGKFFDGIASSGETTIEFPGYYPSGVYFLKLEVEGQSVMKKIVLVK